MEPPGPIPNPEVKRCRADGSAAIGRVRVGRCQIITPPSSEGGVFCAEDRRGNFSKLLLLFRIFTEEAPPILLREPGEGNRRKGLSFVSQNRGRSILPVQLENPTDKNLTLGAGPGSHVRGEV